MHRIVTATPISRNGSFFVDMKRHITTSSYIFLGRKTLDEYDVPDPNCSRTYLSSELCHNLSCAITSVSKIEINVQLRWDLRQKSSISFWDRKKWISCVSISRWYELMSMALHLQFLGACWALGLSQICCMSKLE